MAILLSSAIAAQADPVVTAAGDIACGVGTTGGGCKQMDTSSLILGIAPDAVLPLGDVQYEQGALSDFNSFYAPSWGRVKSITHPAVGNHEYGTSGASGYWDYYNGVGALTGIAGERSKGWYSYDVGNWHLVALNTNCGNVGGCGVGSPEEKWLKGDLAGHACTIVYAHHPRWTSDTRDFDKPEIAPLIQDMYDAGVELYLVGHSHFYERMAPATPSETVDRAAGVRQIIAGTGGRNVYGFGTVEPISEVRNGNTFGVLKLTLHPSSYDWQFVPIPGQSFTDTGSDTCHGPGTGTVTDTGPPTAPSGLTQTSMSSTRVDLSWTASQDDIGVTGYKVFRNGTQIGTSAGTTFADTTVQASTAYQYYAVAKDAAGHDSGPSNTLSLTTPAAPPPSNTSILTFTPSDDAIAEQDTPAVNYGPLNQVTTDNSPVKRLFTRFVVSGVAGRTVTSAKLRLYNVDGSTAGGDFHSSEPSWSESTLTWNLQPLMGTGTVGSLGAVSPGNWYEVNVTPLVSGDGAVSFAATSTSADGAHYSSKEGAAGFAPQLVVTVANNTSDSGPPTPPGNLVATARSSSRVDLTWVASQDDVGVSGYRIFRGGTQVGTSTTASFSDTTGLQENTTYQYYVVATDAAGHVSNPSNTAGATTPAASTLLTFAPTDDSYAQQDVPAATHGSETRFVTDNSPVRRFFARFQVSGVGSKTVTAAKLRIYCVDGSPVGGSFHGADSLWSESSLSWNLQPVMSSGTVASLGPVAAGWYEIDVTPLVAGDGAVTIAATSANSDGAYYSSKEGSAGFAPQLVVSTG
jgi:chitodextrinase